MKFQVVVQCVLEEKKRSAVLFETARRTAYIVPVCPTHLEAPFSRESARFKVAVANDIGEAMTA
jgi:hypothetical protein